VSSNNNYYIVQKGDTLWSIASKYKTTVSKLKDINNLSNNLIVVGQKLLIPNNIKEYIVQKGDTLYSISRKFNTTVSDIISFNNLKTTTIQIGQKLLIP
jgi:LysM repeat protein